MDESGVGPAVWHWISAHDFSAARVLGLSGAQGSGKSTLAGALIARARAQGLRAEAIAIDDYYLTRAERAELAQRVHPLLATRGPPGTHAIDWLAADLAALRQGNSVRVPRFDKAEDERAPEAEWRDIAGPLDLVLFEGWCVGAPPQPPALLDEPINDLEVKEDGDGRWRGWINAQLDGPYRQVFAGLDGLAFLAAPGFACVQAWRAQQESGNGPGPQAMDGASLARFVTHFERLTRWMLEILPARADLTLRLDSARRLVSVQYRVPE